MIELNDQECRTRQRAHEQRVDALLAPHLARRSTGEKHPVADFLFTYYSYRPQALRRWHPGLEVAVTGAVARELGGVRGYAVDGDRAFVDPDFVDGRRETTAWIAGLLESTAGRAPMLGCFGLHEWAMVYRQTADERRHAQFPLRLGARGTDAVVESHRIGCTHYDAFRFFTEPARPLNVISPTRESQQANDQPGCLHAGMDLYKWAYKLAPLTPSELVVDCFELARDIRQVDMAAAPYDLSSLGVEPIAIETTAGKAAYVAEQRAFAERGNALRERLLAVCRTAQQAVAA